MTRNGRNREIARKTKAIPRPKKESKQWDNKENHQENKTRKHKGYIPSEKRITPGETKGQAT